VWCGCGVSGGSRDRWPGAPRKVIGGVVLFLISSIVSTNSGGQYENSEKVFNKNFGVYPRAGLKYIEQNFKPCA